MTRDDISRRRFLKGSAAGISALAAAPASFAGDESGQQMPTRRLGKTDMDVSLLSFGGGSQFMRNPDGRWQPLLDRAIELGVNYFDTASRYGGGADLTSEERYGKILPQYRDEVYIGTKFYSRHPGKARREVERSLDRLQTDYVDILMFHSVEPHEDVDKVEEEIYPMMRDLKDQGMARHIGISSMNSAEKSRELMERMDFDIALLAITATRYGDFVDVALPAARENDVGVLAMKVMRNVVGKKANPRELLDYAWNRDGVSTATVGHYGMDKLDMNARLARSYTPDRDDDPRALERRLAPLAGPHALTWARPGYRDGAPIC